MTPRIPTARRVLRLRRSGKSRGASFPAALPGFRYHADRHRIGRRGTAPTGRPPRGANHRRPGRRARAEQLEEAHDGFESQTGEADVACRHRSRAMVAIRAGQSQQRGSATRHRRTQRIHDLPDARDCRPTTTALCNDEPIDPATWVFGPRTISRPRKQTAQYWNPVQARIMAGLPFMGRRVSAATPTATAAWRPTTRPTTTSRGWTCVIRRWISRRSGRCGTQPCPGLTMHDTAAEGRSHPRSTSGRLSTTPTAGRSYASGPLNRSRMPRRPSSGTSTRRSAIAARAACKRLHGNTLSPAPGQISGTPTGGYRAIVQPERRDDRADRDRRGSAGRRRDRGARMASMASIWMSEPGEPSPRGWPITTTRR